MIQELFHETVRLMQQVVHSLCRTVNVWERFQQTDIGYFRNLEFVGNNHPPPQRLIIEIDKHMYEIKQLKKEVENQKELLQSLLKEVGSRSCPRAVPRGLTIW
jgi:hypothetical protein